LFLTQYYQQLQGTNQVLDISNWLGWFVDRVCEAQIAATHKVDFILQKAKFWDRHKNTVLNKRQHKAMEKIFASGPEGFITSGISNAKYRNITQCSLATATRDLKDLVDKQLLYVAGSGKRKIIRVRA
jgi:Fic family protein